MVVLDEAHHSAADKWLRLLERIQPRQLLGLTGTPERADGLDYEKHFPRPWVGNLRLWNAIPHALVPFRYYMLDVEGVDLRSVAWVAGGYASRELSGKLVGAAEVFVQRAVRAVGESIGRPADLRAIAFCVDVRHAEEVAKHFGQRFLTRVLTGETSREERRSAQDDLNSGRIQVLCVVDIYNEGVDIPNVNTLFFFRPTESATVFLQQLGRGLRRAQSKSELVIFDLTGRQHHNFRFDRRLRAMLGQTTRELRELVNSGFGRLPSGCHLQFDEVARADVLAQIRLAIPDDLNGLCELLKEPAHAMLTLKQFLRETEVELEAIYRKDRSWALLRQRAGLETRTLATGEEQALRKLSKLLHVGDSLRLDNWERLAGLVEPTSERDARVMRMLFAVLYGKEQAPRQDAWSDWQNHAVLREELAALAGVLRDRNAFLSEAHVLEPHNPLVLHGRYLGVELSAAFDNRTRDGDFRDYYTGVESIADKRFDLLLVTLEKAAGIKEHLRYRDFPLNQSRFQWQSKANTTQDSALGRRHLDPGAQPCTPLLFVRQRNDERTGVTMAFQYLGPVRPDRVTGERPITIEWALDFAMPIELLRHGRIAA